ncbi:unnamed protein product [Prorocentrum cordatum]|uniref:Uncharacterized protein n=1 Tax=Prorocentrum cordatum TaxID=2364126 RepID=A0ABN9WT58_9DINO|nr:unnamed protein product [Polarella glacialis]
MQITRSGFQHSLDLGRILAAQYGPGGARPLPGLAGCPAGSVFLAADAVEKQPEDDRGRVRGALRQKAECRRVPRLGGAGQRRGVGGRPLLRGQRGVSARGPSWTPCRAPRTPRWPPASCTTFGCGSWRPRRRG